MKRLGSGWKDNTGFWRGGNYNKSKLWIFAYSTHLQFAKFHVLHGAHTEWEQTMSLTLEMLKESET